MSGRIALAEAFLLAKENRRGVSESAVEDFLMCHREVAGLWEVLREYLYNPQVYARGVRGFVRIRSRGNRS